MASWFWQPKQVRMHLHGQEQSIEGILIHRPNHFYRLVEPKLVVAENISQALDGDVWVPSDRVLWMQVLTQ